MAKKRMVRARLVKNQMKVKELLHQVRTPDLEVPELTLHEKYIRK